MTLLQLPVVSQWLDVTWNLQSHITNCCHLPGPARVACVLCSCSSLFVLTSWALVLLKARVRRATDLHGSLLASSACDVVSSTSPVV